MWNITFYNALAIYVIMHVICAKEMKVESFHEAQEINFELHEQCLLTQTVSNSKRKFSPNACENNKKNMRHMRTKRSTFYNIYFFTGEHCTPPPQLTGNDAAAAAQLRLFCPSPAYTLPRLQAHSPGHSATTALHSGLLTPAQTGHHLHCKHVDSYSET